MSNVYWHHNQHSSSIVVVLGASKCKFAWRKNKVATFGLDHVVKVLESVELIEPILLAS